MLVLLLVVLLLLLSLLVLVLVVLLLVVVVVVVLLVVVLLLLVLFFSGDGQLPEGVEFALQQAIRGENEPSAITKTDILVNKQRQVTELLL